MVLFVSQHPAPPDVATPYVHSLGRQRDELAGFNLKPRLSAPGSESVLYVL
jgi:hypothetical protein